MSEDHTARTGEASVDDAVVERAADRYGVDAERITDALVVLHADLIGRHSEFEEHDYVTVDDTRAYRVPAAVWEDLRSGVDVADDVAGAVAFAHTEQARLAFADATGVDERFADDERGVVVSIDTAEEF